MMPERKTFTIDVVAGVVTPALHSISLSSQEEIGWTINAGTGRVVFDPAVGDPVVWSQGPNFSKENPAVGTAKTAGTFVHTVSYWYDLGSGGNKEHESLQMVLIIEP
jgi:hypothetical protein